MCYSSGWMLCNPSDPAYGRATSPFRGGFEKLTSPERGGAERREAEGFRKIRTLSCNYNVTSPCKETRTAIDNPPKTCYNHGIRSGDGEHVPGLGTTRECASQAESAQRGGPGVPALDERRFARVTARMSGFTSRVEPRMHGIRPGGGAGVFFIVYHIKGVH